MAVAVAKQAAISVALMNSFSLSVNQQACANYGQQDRLLSPTATGFKVPLELQHAGWSASSHRCKPLTANVKNRKQHIGAHTHSQNPQRHTSLLPCCGHLMQMAPTKSFSAFCEKSKALTDSVCFYLLLSAVHHMKATVRVTEMVHWHKVHFIQTAKLS